MMAIRQRHSHISGNLSGGMAVFCFWLMPYFRKSRKVSELLYIKWKAQNALAAEYNAIKHENNISYYDKMASAINELGMNYPVN